MKEDSIMEYIPHGVCSHSIHIELDGDTIESVTFIGGCNGNAKGISSLIRGMNVDEAISRLGGITCGDRRTSCPDQLARALVEAKKLGTG